MDEDVEFYREVLTVKQDRYIGTDKVFRERFFNSQGELDRGEDMPSIIVYDFDTGKPSVMTYFTNGQCHRVGKPADYEISPETGMIVSEEWYIDGKEHREGGLPSTIHRNAETGQITYQRFCVHGKETRPAIDLEPSGADPGQLEMP